MESANPGSTLFTIVLVNTAPAVLLDWLALPPLLRARILWAQLLIISLKFEAFALPLLVRSGKRSPMPPGRPGKGIRALSTCESELLILKDDSEDLLFRLADDT